MDNCIFCKIIKGELPSHKIYEDKYVYAFLDIACDYYGHTLVVPKQHCTNVLDCKPKTLNRIMAAVQKIAKHYVSNCGYDGVNITNANGKSAEQSVFHLHVHIMPRKTGDNVSIWPNLPKQEYDLAKICNELKLW